MWDVVGWIVAAVAVVVGVVWVLAEAARGRRAVRREREASDARLIEETQRRAAEVDEEATRTKRAQALADRFHAAALESVGQEVASRDLILRACREAGLSGVLFTNVVFATQPEGIDDAVVTQVSHVVVFERSVLLIENKSWSGVIFDGALPSSIHPSYARLVDESALDDQFAIRLTFDADRIGRLVETGHLSPRHLSRRRANQLRKALAHDLEESPWIDTSVLYSHRDALIYAGANPPGGTTVTGLLRLPETLASHAARHAQAGAVPHTTTIAPYLRALSADAAGFGDFAAEWPGIPVAPRSATQTVSDGVDIEVAAHR